MTGARRLGHPRLGDARLGHALFGDARLGVRWRESRCRQRDLLSLLREVGDLMPGHHDLEYLPVDLPVPELPGENGIPAQVDNVEPVAEVIEHQAGVAPVVAHRPRLPQRVEVADVDLLAPVSGCATKAEFLRRRAGGEQRHLSAVGTEAGLVRSAAVRGHQPVSHAYGSEYCQARPSYWATSSSPSAPSLHRPAPTGIGMGSM
jgi:hypothetical protein